MPTKITLVEVPTQVFDSTTSVVSTVVVADSEGSESGYAQAVVTKLGAVSDWTAHTSPTVHADLSTLEHRLGVC